MNIELSISRLRKVAFFLFIIPTIALIGSLLFHNILISYKFSHGENYTIENIIPGEKVTFELNQDNNFGRNIKFDKYSKLGECNIYEVDKIISLEKSKIFYMKMDPNFQLDELIKNTNEKIYYKIQFTKKLNDKCILNSNLIYVYKLIPIVFEKIYDLKYNKKTSLGTSGQVNPILNGETSISNIVKRYPVKMLFKPLMYVSIILMIVYWYLNNLVLNNINNRIKNNNFYIFGILSAIFLFFHVIFLGWSFETEIFAKGRRYFVVFFILFEILAQTFLIVDILKNKNRVSSFLNDIVVKLKVIFIILICSSSIIILVTLSIYNLSSKVDYILEWNYFLILLLFYFLSSIMWKKKLLSYPTST